MHLRRQQRSRLVRDDHGAGLDPSLPARVALGRTQQARVRLPVGVGHGHRFEDPRDAQREAVVRGDDRAGCETEDPCGLVRDRDVDDRHARLLAGGWRTEPVLGIRRWLGVEHAATETRRDAVDPVDARSQSRLVGNVGLLGEDGGGQVAGVVLVGQRRRHGPDRQSAVLDARDSRGSPVGQRGPEPVVHVLQQAPKRPRRVLVGRVVH